MVTGLHLNNLVVQSFLEDMDCFLDLQGIYGTAMINVLEDSSQFLEDLLFTLYVSLRLFNINFVVEDLIHSKWFYKLSN